MACRSSGRSRSNTAPRARTRTRFRSSSSAANAAPSRRSGSTSSARSSSASASRAIGTHPYTTMAYEAEAQIAREIMSFATSDQLYRGSKPVMWSSVERTALAEAEVEYHEKTSPTIWVKFPITRHARRRSRRRLGRHLDHDPLDDPGQPRHRLRIGHPLRPLCGHRGRRRTTGPRSATASFSPTSSRPTCSRPPGSPGYERVKDVLPVMIERCAHPFRGLAGRERLLGFRRADAARRLRDRRCRHGLRAHRSRPRRGRLQHLCEAQATCSRPAARRKCRTRSSPDSSYFPDVPFFAGERIYDDKGKDAARTRR